MGEKQTFLRIKDLIKRFGGVTALNGVSFDVEKSELIGIMGPNGSGKTTLLNCISGIYETDGGEIFFKGELINKLEPHQITQRGISRTFQVTRVFRKLSVLENVLLAASHLKEERDILRARAFKLLDFVGILHMKDNLAGELSGGQEKLLEFARVLMPDPEVILMDEPFAGIHPLLKNKFMGRIKELNKEEEKTFIIISHDIPTTLELCEKVIVLDKGEKIAEGSPRQIRDDKKVIEAYLG